RAAVDVVPDATRRHDALFFVERRDPADREAVAPVDVGHREGRADDPRKRRDVRDLLERSVVDDASRHRSVRVHDPGNAHPRTECRGETPSEVVDPLERPDAIAHRSRITVTRAGGPASTASAWYVAALTAVRG